MNDRMRYLLLLLICVGSRLVAAQDTEPAVGRHFVSTKAVLLVGRHFNAKYEYALGPGSGVFAEVQYYANRGRPSIYSATLGQTLYGGDVITRYRSLLLAAGYRKYFGGRGSRGQWFGEGALLAELPSDDTAEWTAAVRELQTVAPSSRTERLTGPGFSFALGYQYKLPKNFIIGAQFGVTSILERQVNPLYGSSGGILSNSGGAANSMLTIGRRF